MQFSGFCLGNTPKKKRFFKPKKWNNFCPEHSNMAIFAKSQTKMTQKFCRKQIFAIFTFFPIFNRFLGSKSRKFEKLAQKPAKNRKKSENRKNVFPTEFLCHFCLQLGHKWPYLSVLGKSYFIFQIKKSIFRGISYTKPWKLRLGPNFATSYLGNAKNFFNSVKSS